MKAIVERPIVLAVFVPLIADAQGTLYVSNLGQSSTGGMEVGSDSWIAQEFSISASDPNSYTFDSVQLLMDSESGNPSNFTVSIYNALQLNTPPREDLGTLDGSTDPSTSGVFTYSASGIIFSPGDTYFVVVTAATPVSQGAYYWSTANWNDNDVSGTWTVDDTYYYADNSTHWVYDTGGDVFQMAIYATPIPEPSTWALAFLGGGILFLFVTLNQGKRHESHR
jgi:hypothetical protein